MMTKQVAKIVPQEHLEGMVVVILVLILIMQIQHILIVTALQLVNIVGMDKDQIITKQVAKIVPLEQLANLDVVIVVQILEDIHLNRVLIDVIGVQMDKNLIVMEQLVSKY